MQSQSLILKIVCHSPALRFWFCFSWLLRLLQPIASSLVLSLWFASFASILQLKLPPEAIASKLNKANQPYLLKPTMKFSTLALAATALAFPSAQAFAPTSSVSLARPSSAASTFASSSRISSSSSRSPAFVSRSSAALSMSYTVGVVGATGAVGKEIVGCLEKSSFPVGKLRIFGSSRSAGSTRPTGFGDIEVELFEEDKARECDVVFLAVDGDFALKHARNIAEGDDGAVVIDNSVSAGSACCLRHEIAA